MTDMQFLLVISIAIVGVVSSGLFSGLETGIYSLNRVRLHLLTHQGNWRALILSRLLENPNALLASLLIGTNVATYVTTAAIGKLLAGAGYSDGQIIIYNVLMVTPLLFVLAETLPKDLFSVFADRLVYPFARFLQVLKWGLTLTGLLPLVTGLSSVFMRLLGIKKQDAALSHPRRRIGMFMREGVGHGLLSDGQSAMMQRVLVLHQRCVEDEMTPWQEVVTVQQSDDAQSLWALAKRSSLSRYPVLDDTGSVMGVVSLYEALFGDKKLNVAQRCRSILQIEAGTASWAALGQLKQHHASLAVVQQNGQPVGIVTIKDLVEPITGELASW